MLIAEHAEWEEKPLSDRAIERNGFLSTNDHYEAARILKERALEDKSGWINSHLRIVGSVFRYLFLKDQWPGYAKYHMALSGENEVQFMLTYRTHMKPAWHLSFTPCRYGELQPGEWETIQEAFGIPIGAERIQDGHTTHVVWD